MEQWVHILTGLYVGLMLVNFVTYMLDYNWWGFDHPAFVAILFASLLGLGVVMAVFSVVNGCWLEVLAGAGMASVVLSVCQLLSQDHCAVFAKDWPDHPKRMDAVLDEKLQPIIYVGLGALAAIARIVLTAYIRS